MRKAATLLLALLLGGGWLFSQRFDIKGLDQIAVTRQQSPDDAAGGAAPVATADAPPVERPSDTIRVASFNIQVFGQSKLGKPRVMQVLAEVIRRFDVVAIQEIRSKNQNLLPKFVELINATGRQYDYVIGPRLGRTTSKEQYAFVFDAASIEVDRGATYTVEDRHDLLHREPLVSAFRVRGPPPERAFTFTLINIHTDPDETDQELDALDDVFREVRGDGRGEDDIILLGDLNVDDRHLGELGAMPGVMWLISGVPTNTRGTHQYDNIVLHRAATVEFAGRAGVFDLMREFNLTMDEALDVSDHLPIWGEFQIYEGGAAAAVATR